VTIDDIHFASVMRTLTDYCFVEVQKATEQKVRESWSMHNCVHDWTVAALNKVIDAQQYWYAFDCIAASIHEDDWSSFGHLSYARLAAHAAWLAQGHFWRNDLISDNLPNRLDKSFYIAYLLESQVQLTAAERFYRWALAGKEKALGPDHTSTLDTVHNLGDLYVAQGKLGLAEEFYQRALAGSEKALGPDHTSTLDTVHNLGNLYETQGKLGLAEEFYQRALAGYEKALQPETIPALNTVTNLGLLYHGQGRTEEAEKMFQRAMLGRKKVLGADHPHTLQVVNELKKLRIERNENEHQNADRDHTAPRKRDRLKSLLRLKGSRVGHSHAVGGRT
jgi:tetratricopeptide (TPR) repeat protein